MKTIAIIGGGPGGLIAANLLMQKAAKSYDISIFEANYRLGGKVLTGTFNNYPVIYEAGVAELYKLCGGKDPLYNLLKTFGFSFLPMKGETTIVDNKIVKGVEDLKRVFGEVCWKQVNDFISKGRQLRSPKDFAGAGWPADNKHPWAKENFCNLLSKELTLENARNYFEAAIKSDLATECSSVNGVYGFDNYLVSDDEYCELYTIRGGIEQFIYALARNVEDKVSIHLNSMVKALKYDKNSFELTILADNKVKLFSFDSVMICLPQQWLAGLSLDNKLNIPIAKHLAHYNYPAHYLKVAILFECPFWEDYFGNDSYFTLDAFGGCCVYNESARYPADGFGCLNWLLAGSTAEAYSNMDDSYIIKRVLDSLPPALSKKCHQYFIEGKVHRWAGSVNGQPGGLPLKSIEEKHLPNPDLNQLILVGDYLFDSTLNGLLDSADLATSMLLTNLDSKLRTNPSKNYPLSSKVRYMVRNRS